MGTRSIAVLGLGGMGGGMAHALLSAGFRVTVYNRTAAKADSLVAAGASRADSPAEAVADADVVLISLADERAVEEVLFGSVLGKLRPEQQVIDTSTVSPDYARRAAQRLAEHGNSRVEACVVGNPKMANSGQLRVFAAGEESAVDSVRDVLDAIGQQVRYLGAPGTASSLKLAFNLMLGVQTAGLAEALNFTEASGLDRELVVGALRDMAWGAFALGFRADFMLERSYRPAGFRSVLMHKDLRLAAQESAALDVSLPLVEQAALQYESVISAGRGDEDAAVVLEKRD
ncbi:NAD(P)-dependent oxidoreductase [Amycolatopsis nigrescens]|uniref:NAD(P)-dependent oxidoreductase n=1 Tax=Amycolatopsis nigrescens TaxID=381445 RepID=UPI0003647393|nr:NAD(P)-dependent oxidoreductase [Amycolatopsis nigrescens]